MEIKKYYVQWYPIRNTVGLISDNDNFDEFKAKVDAKDKKRESVIVPVYDREHFVELKTDDKIKKLTDIVAKDVSEIVASFTEDTQDLTNFRGDVFKRIFLGSRLTLDGVTESGQQFVWDISSPLPMKHDMRFFEKKENGE